MAKTETTKDVIMPTIKTVISFEVIIASAFNMYFNILRALAPNITGIARKKEYSAATSLDVPISIAPSIVEPERDVPGISERVWKQPIAKAFL